MMDLYPVPSSDFCRKLREFDPNLQLNFDPAHGVWAIWCHDPYTGALDHVLNVVNADGSYRPLDDRVFLILRANRFYQDNPDLLIEKVIDEPLRKHEQAVERSKENARLLANDKALEKEFNAIVDKLRSVPLDDFLKPVVARDSSGAPVRINKNQDGQGGELVYIYKPDSDLLSHGTRVLQEEFNK